MSPRRRSAEVVVIYWRDIPAQVTARVAGRGPAQPAKVLLDARFQHAIDRAAVVADCTDTASYVAQWRRATEPLEGDAAATAHDRAAALEAQYPPERLEQLVVTGGWDAAIRDEPSPRRPEGRTRT